MNGRTSLCQARAEAMIESAILKRCAIVGLRAVEKDCIMRLIRMESLCALLSMHPWIYEGKGAPYLMWYTPASITFRIFDVVVVIKLVGERLSSFIIIGRSWSMSSSRSKAGRPSEDAIYLSTTYVCHRVRFEHSM
jgi:hypothetical protein